MAASKTITVPHLGGIQVGYAIAGGAGGHIDPRKPTVVLLNSMCMTAALYAAQFADARLTAAANLVAIEPLGHGATRVITSEGHFTYWDSALMALQVMDQLQIRAAYVLGTSQGGWIAARMALLAPARVAGLLLLGTSMDYESGASRAQGCWDPQALLSPFLAQWAAASPAAAGADEDDNFVIDDAWCGLVAGVGFGDHGTPETAAYWTRVLKTVYRGREGRQKARLALLNLLTRDGLLLRLGDVQCPVHWLQVCVLFSLPPLPISFVPSPRKYTHTKKKESHDNQLTYGGAVCVFSCATQGTKDTPYGTTAPAEHIKLFTSALRAELTLVPGGAHYLNATNPKETAEAILAMIA